MKAGDLVIRKIQSVPEWKLAVAINQKELLGYGLILSKQIGGNPTHPCITVYYPKVGKIYDIAENLMEVIGESH